jgi:hypothetical protein
MAYTIVWHHAGISTTTFVQTFLSLLGKLGRSGFAQKADPAKKKILTSCSLCIKLECCCPCNNGPVAIVNAQASLPSL